MTGAHTQEEKLKRREEDLKEKDRDVEALLAHMLLLESAGGPFGAGRGSRGGRQFNDQL